jgi:hypothetical protein
MQRTSDRVADDQAVGELAAIVRTATTDGEESVPGPHDDDLVVADHAGERRAIGEAADGDASSQIRKCLR